MICKTAPSTHRVKGLFINLLASNPLRHRSTGVVQEPKKQAKAQHTEPLSVPAPHYVDLSTLFGRYWQKACANKAILLGAQELIQQRIGGRVQGLLALFQDGTARVLGGWDPSKLDHSSTIYATQNGTTLKSLTFVFSGGPARQRFLQSIVVNSDDVVEPHFI